MESPDDKIPFGGMPVQINFHAEVNAEKTGDDGDVVELVPVLLPNNSALPPNQNCAHVAVI